MGDRYYYDHRGGGGRRGNPKKWSFVFPFLLLIVIGVILVLGFQVFRFIFPGTEKDAVYMYTANGSASIKMWGTSDFAKAYSGTKILQGDEIRTAKDSKVIVKVFDGTLIRLSGDTYVTFNEIFSDGGKNDVQLILNEGEVWVNKTQATSSDTNFVLSVGKLDVKPVGTVFDVSRVTGVDSVRVMYGAIVVDVYSEDGGTAVDHIDVDEGNEAIFDAEKMAKFWAFQAPNVVVPLSDGFKGTPWYAWNIAEDEAPTDLVASPTIGYGEESNEVSPVESAVVPTETVVPVVPETAAISPVVTYGLLTTPKVLSVNGVVYTASQLEAGVAVDTVVVKVVGEVTGAEKVLVNSYQLQKFVPSAGKETFIYWANGNSSNMKAGENLYNVYGIASDGTKSGVATFKLIYTPKAETVDNPSI